MKDRCQGQRGRKAMTPSIMASKETAEGRDMDSRSCFLLFSLYRQGAVSAPEARGRDRGGAPPQGWGLNAFVVA